MSTLVDNLISTLQNKIACGEKDARIEPDVLAEFMSDFAPAPQVRPEMPKEVKEPVRTEIKTQEAEIEKAFEPPPAEQPVKQPEKMPDLPVEPAAPEAPADISSLTLEELRKYGNTCSACDFALGEVRSENTAVNEQAELMIITEPAGRSEEFMSDPFHGEAGNLLLKMIRAMNIDPDSIYLCMAHRCYGPGAREKIGETKPYLTRQIELVSPKAILIFGGAALNILLGEQSLMNCRGRWLEIGDIPAIATFPPAYLIHKPESKKDAWNDMQQVMARLQA